MSVIFLNRVFQQSEKPQNANPTFEDLSIDDNLSQIDRLVRYSKSSIGLQRLVHAKMIGDISSLVGFEQTKALIIPLLSDLSVDPEPAVRQHMVEQLSPLAQVIDLCVILHAIFILYTVLL